MASGAPDWWIQGIIPLSYVNLDDTPGDYIGRAGLVPEVNAGETALAWSAAKIDGHKSRHAVGGADALAHSDLDPQTSDHHVRYADSEVDAIVLTHKNIAGAHHTKYSDAEARAAINDIFGSDGKADKDIDLDSNELITGRVKVGPQGNAATGRYSQNAYWTGSQWKLTANGYALLFQLSDSAGNVIIYSAPSGSADDVITWTARFTLDVSGNLTAVATYDGIDLRKPVMVSCAAFIASTAAGGWTLDGNQLVNSGLLSQYFYAGVNLPDGLDVSELRLYGYRDDAAATLEVKLYRSAGAGSSTEMASVTANWTSGWSNLPDSTISSATVDNSTYCYYLRLQLDPNNAVGDVTLGAARISFTQ